MKRHKEWPRLGAAALLVAVMTVATQAADAQAAAGSRWHVGGFGDLELHTPSEAVREGVDFAELDIYGSATLTESWSLFGEGVVQRDLHAPGDPAISIDLERLFAQYQRSDALQIEIGEVHTGIVRWNARESRSRFLQTPIDVPAMARRPQDDGAWPLRMMGAYASGRLAGSAGISYGFGFGAGSGNARDRIPLFSRNFSPAATLSISLSPDAVPGLEVALTGYVQHLDAQPQPLRERDLTLALNYVNGGAELRGEFGRMSHRATNAGTTYRTTGYYLLLSKRLFGRWQPFRPYVLIDRLDTPTGESYLLNVTPENAWAAGLRYDLTPRLSLKGEYRSQRALTGDRESIAGAQIGFSF